MKVRKGQLYADNDPRRNYRELEVIGFTDRSRKVAVVENIDTERKTTISTGRLVRNNNRGFSLLED